MRFPNDIPKIPPDLLQTLAIAEISKLPTGKHHNTTSATKIDSTKMKQSSFNEASKGYVPLQVLGRGTASTVYSIPFDLLAPPRQLCLKTGHNSEILQHEFKQARDIYSLYCRLARSAIFLSSCGDVKLPHIPLHQEFHPENDSGFWEPVKHRIGCQEDLLSGILMERIPSMPAAVGKMLIRRYFDENKVERSILRGEHEDFLIRLLFGRSDPKFDTTPIRTNPTITTTATSVRRSVVLHRDGHIVSTTASSCAMSTTYVPAQTVAEPSLPTLSSLADLPASLPLIKSEIPTRAWKLVSSVAAGYALMHWGSHVDGSGTEFVLAGGDGIKVWMLDFDKCRTLEFPPNKSIHSELVIRDIIHHRIVPVMVDGGYVPRFGEEEEMDDTNSSTMSRKSRKVDDETLWETFRCTYISVGMFCAEFVGRPDLVHAPEIVCDAMEIAVSQERMGLLADGDMIVFEDDDEPGQENLGWGSGDDEHEDDSEANDDEDSDEEGEYGGGNDDSDQDSDEEEQNNGSDDENEDGFIPSLSVESFNLLTQKNRTKTLPVSWEENPFENDSEGPIDTPNISTEGEEDPAACVFADPTQEPSRAPDKRHESSYPAPWEEDWEVEALPDPLDPEELIPARFSAMCCEWLNLPHNTCKGMHKAEMHREFT